MESDDKEQLISMIIAIEYMLYKLKIYVNNLPDGDMPPTLSILDAIKSGFFDIRDADEYC